MTEPIDFVAELRADVAEMPHHPYTADLLSRAAAEIARLRAENERLTAALKAAEPHVRATNESEHMMDGFGGVRERPSDLDLDLVQRALTNGDCG